MALHVGLHAWALAVRGTQYHGALCDQGRVSSELLGWFSGFPPHTELIQVWGAHTALTHTLECPSPALSPPAQSARGAPAGLSLEVSVP